MMTTGSWNSARRHGEALDVECCHPEAPLIVVKKMRERTTKVIPGGVRSEAEVRMTDVVG